MLVFYRFLHHTYFNGVHLTTLVTLIDLIAQNMYASIYLFGNKDIDNYVIASINFLMLPIRSVQKMLLVQRWSCIIFS